MSLRGLVPCIPSPNHQRLVADCYPKSKQAIDPDSNSLGKLTFYTKARPVKLAKVANVLVSRSQRASEPINSLCITLTILKRLLDECRGDINVFSGQAIHIISISLSHKAGANEAIELHERIAGAFYALVMFADFAAVDEASYFRLLQGLCQTASNDQSPQLRLLGLHAIEGLINSELLYSSDFAKQAEYIVPTLLNDMGDGGLSADELDSTAHASSSDEHAKDSLTVNSRRPLHDRRARSIRIAKGLVGTEKPPGKDASARRACQHLKKLFASSSPRQLEDLLHITVNTSRSSKQSVWRDEAWLTWLYLRYLEWTQPQYRFAIVTFWLDQSVKIDNATTPTQQESSLRMLTSLLSAPIAVLNLAIGEVLNALLSLVERDPLRSAARSAVSALGTHTYYPEQFDDIVCDVLARATDNYSAVARGNGARTQALIAVLQCLQDILQGTQSQRPSFVSFPFDQVQDSLAILDHAETSNSAATIQQTYLVLLKSLLQLYSSSSATSYPSDSQGATGVPQITLHSAGTPIQHAFARLAKEIQIRLYGTVRKPLGASERDSILDILIILYSQRDAQATLGGIPVLLAWTPNHDTSIEYSLAGLKTACLTWDVQDGENISSCIAALSKSSALQHASGQSEVDLHAQLSKPFAHSPTGASLLQHTPGKKSRSIRGSPAHGDGTMSSPYGSRSRASSIPSTSLADLKNSLSGNTAIQHGSTHGAIPSHLHYDQSGQNSPSRSTGVHTSVASSIRSSVAGDASVTHNPTPPRGVSAIDHQQEFLMLPGSIESPTRGSRKPRLERILGSTDDMTHNERGSRHAAPHRLFTPPYAQ